MLPGNRIKSIICTGLDDCPAHVFHANFGGLLSISEGVEEWSPESRRRARQHLDAYKSIRRFLGADYYPLFPQPRSLEEWDGWQFHDLDGGEGFVLSFRARSPQEAANARFRGLDPRREYLLTDPYSGEEVVAAGRALEREGVVVSLPVDCTRLLRYRPR